ncbi:hypothetical protein AGLY_009969, partial [Aphis glycines]
MGAAGLYSFSTFKFPNSLLQSIVTKSQSFKIWSTCNLDNFEASGSKLEFLSHSDFELDFVVLSRYAGNNDMILSILTLSPRWIDINPNIYNYEFDKGTIIFEKKNNIIFLSKKHHKCHAPELLFLFLCAHNGSAFNGRYLTSVSTHSFEKVNCSFIKFKANSVCRLFSDIQHSTRSTRPLKKISVSDRSKRFIKIITKIISSKPFVHGNCDLNFEIPISKNINIEKKNKHRTAYIIMMKLAMNRSCRFVY